MIKKGQVKISKDDDGDGRTDCFQRAGGWCEPAAGRSKTHHFRVEDPNTLHPQVGVFRLPALRDRICWDLKRQYMHVLQFEWYHGLDFQLASRVS